MGRQYPQSCAWPNPQDLGMLLTDVIECVCVCVCVCVFRAASMACGGPQARGQIGAVAADLLHSHSNWGSELQLQLTPQLTSRQEPLSS